MRLIVGQSKDGTWHRLKDPFELAITLVMLISALIQLGFGTPPDSLASLLPTWAQIIWLGIIIVSGGAVLAGVLWKELITGMFIESVGLSGMAMSLVTYGLAILVRNGFAPGTLVSVSSIMVVGIAYWWKRVQLRRVLGVLPT
jgi:hypothetical protein